MLHPDDNVLVEVCDRQFLGRELGNIPVLEFINNFHLIIAQEYKGIVGENQL
jgi:hypothetical protein